MTGAAGPPSGPGLQRLGRLRGVLALGLVAAVVALAPMAPAAASHPRNAYHQTNLVSDLPGLAQLTDPDLVRHCCIWRSSPSLSSTRALNAAFAIRD